MTATTKEIRDAVEFVERLVIVKSNRHRSLSNEGYIPVMRKPRESFVDFALRVRKAFPPNHKLPRLRVRNV